MRRTSEALFQHNSVDSMVRQTLNTALEVLGAEAGSLQLYDAQEDSLVFRYVVGPATERLTGYSMPASQGIAGQVFRTGVPDLTEHADQRAGFNPDIDKVSGYHTESMMTVPVKRPEGNPSALCRFSTRISPASIATTSKCCRCFAGRQQRPSRQRV
jgi:hypothetical protein